MAKQVAEPRGGIPVARKRAEAMTNMEEQGENGRIVALSPRTTVTVTQVADYSGLPTPTLHNFIQGKVGECHSIVEKLNKTVRQELYPALLEMERRYGKQPGARTDLGELSKLTWYQYLESVGVTPEAFRKWKSRNAVSEMQKHLLPEPPRPKPNKPVLMPDESEASLIAKAGLRVASTLLNPLLPEKERVAKAVEYSQEMAEAVQGGAYETLTDEPHIEGLAQSFNRVFVRPDVNTKAAVREFLRLIPEFWEELRDALNEMAAGQPEKRRGPSTTHLRFGGAREEHGGDDPVSPKPLVGNEQGVPKKSPESVARREPANALSALVGVLAVVRAHPKGGYGIYDSRSSVCLYRCDTEAAAWDTLAAANTAHRDAANG